MGKNGEVDRFLHIGSIGHRHFRSKFIATHRCILSCYIKNSRKIICGKLADKLIDVQRTGIFEESRSHCASFHCAEEHAKRVFGLLTAEQLRLLAEKIDFGQFRFVFQFRSCIGKEGTVKLDDIRKLVGNAGGGSALVE